MLIGFKKRFREPILIGTKVFTLRNRRKRQPKLGEQLHMYTALRTKYAELITNKEKLMGMQQVRLTIQWKADLGGYEIKIWVDRRPLSKKEIDQFVKYDGFKDRNDFLQYWMAIPGRKALRNRLGALLVMFHWTDLKY